MLIADKAYAYDPTRNGLRRRGIAHTFPERSDQVARRVCPSKPRRTTAVVRQGDLPAAKRRVERCFQPVLFKQWRDLPRRYAKRAALYGSSLLLIAALIWLR
ncbi:hypothetical protein GCM10020358_36430 [Amorphoplanes nipponensis]|uniref:hypothetical protein n=1 Tax=Actinoplanes nipponensis TaxID=135950 RepID=UPI003371B2A6